MNTSSVSSLPKAKYMQFFFSVDENNIKTRILEKEVEMVDMIKNYLKKV